MINFFHGPFPAARSIAKRGTAGMASGGRELRPRTLSGAARLTRFRCGGGRASGFCGKGKAASVGAKGAGRGRNDGGRVRTVAGQCCWPESIGPREASAARKLDCREASPSGKRQLPGNGNRRESVVCRDASGSWKHRLPGLVSSRRNSRPQTGAPRRPPPNPACSCSSSDSSRRGRRCCGPPPSHAARAGRAPSAPRRSPPE